MAVVRPLHILCFGHCAYLFTWEIVSRGCYAAWCIIIIVPAVALDNWLGLTGPAMGWSSWNHLQPLR